MMTINAGGQTLGDCLEDLIPSLEKTGDTPGLDAQVLLAHLLDKPRSWVMAHPETCLTGEQVATLESLVLRLQGGEPLPYVLGEWEFFALPFELTPDVLIPRPETELLVEHALGWLRVHPDQRHMADIGAGSGCIGIALAVNVPDLRVTATDISPQAVEVARRNAQKHAVAERVTVLQADLLIFPGPYSLICSNLPYIPTQTLRTLPVYGREPTIALDGGADGLDLVRRLLASVPDILAPGGLMLLEIEASQGSKVLSLAYDTFAEARIHLHQDMAGHDRLLEIQL